MGRRLHQITISIYGLLFALLYGVIGTAQVLGFAYAFESLLAAVVALIVMLMAAAAYFRRDNGWFVAAFSADGHEESGSLLKYAALLGSVLALTIAILQRLIRWPYSGLGVSLPSDAIGYHFPKAVELYHSGSSWNLSIPYGQYPFGYESLLSQGLALTGNEMLFGLIHALIALFFVLTIVLLLHRYTRLPTAFAFLAGIAFLFFTPVYQQVLLVGKNDVLLSAGVLAALLHSPLSTKNNEGVFHPFGLAFASMIVASTKANGMLPIAALWLLVLFYWWRRGRTYLSPRVFMLTVLTMLPGALWIIRNIVVMKTIFSPDLDIIYRWSIAYNLTNPYLYVLTDGTRILLGVMLLVVVSLILSWKIGKPRLPVVVVMSLLLLAFIITPGSGFLIDLTKPATIYWRYGLYVLAFAFVIIMLLATPLVLRLFDLIRARRLLEVATATIIIGGMFGGLWLLNRDGALFSFDPENILTLTERWRQPVGVDGYHSVYDYVRRNIEDSVIDVQGGPLYYLYGADFSNTLLINGHPLGIDLDIERPEADYTVVFGSPDTLNTPEWEATWLLVYEDRRGRVYQRRSG